MWGSATLAIVVSSPCMMFANMIDSVTQPRLATGPRDAIPGLDESAIRISPWSKNGHIMISLTNPKAKPTGRTAAALVSHSSERAGAIRSIADFVRRGLVPCIRVFLPPRGWAWMPTDQVRGLKAHRTGPAMTIRGLSASPAPRADASGNQRERLGRRDGRALRLSIRLSATRQLNAPIAKWR